MIDYIGDISKNDAIVLKELAEGAESILEFGCGASTQVLSFYSMNQITSIDTDPVWINKTKSNFDYLGISDVPLYRMYAEFPFTGEYDLIFDDGADGLRRDFALSIWHCLKIGGILAFHDTRRWGDQGNACIIIHEFFNEIEEIKCNYKSSNITIIKKKVYESYDNWQVTENKEPWQLGWENPPKK